MTDAAREPAGPDPRVLVVIVNYRVGRLAVDALASVAPELAALRPRGTAVVVDNDSGDDSAEVLEAAIAERGWGAWARVHRSPRNGGFAYGNNQAVRPALASATPPDVVFLLNPDARMTPGCLRRVLDVLADRPEVGLVGPAVHDEDGARRPSAYRFPSIVGELTTGARLGALDRLLARWSPSPAPPEATTLVDWVSGAAVAIRREVFDAIGLMDEGYFLYFEETDFTWRAREAGFRCAHLPSARVVHVGGQSTGVTGKARHERRRRPSYWFDSRRRFFERRRGVAYARAADLAFGAGLLFHEARCALLRRDPYQPERFVPDFFEHAVRGRIGPRESG